jgi:hypothetical protein
MPSRIRELRVITGTTFNKTHSAANSATWDAATKLAPSSVDLSKLEDKGIAKKTLQTRLHSGAGVSPALRTGSIGFTIPAGVGSANNTAPVEATLASKILGGLYTPAAKSSNCDAECTTTDIFATGHSAANGGAVLIGGEVRRVSNVTNADHFTLEMALNSAPVANTVITYAHTAYLVQNAAQEYFDCLAIGWNDADQVQTIGGAATLKVVSKGTDEPPELEFDINVADHQEVPSNERASLTPATAPSGGDAPASKALGGYFLGDWANTTRSAVESDDWAIDLGVAHEKKPGPNGINGIGGWKKTGGIPKTEVSVLIDSDRDGLVADFYAKTEKQQLFQWGQTAGACFAVTQPRGVITERPGRVGIGNLQGQRLKVESKEPTLASPANNLYSSAAALHWF